MGSQTVCTTYANLYEQQLSQAVTTYKTTHLKTLSAYCVPTSIPIDITAMMSLQRNTTNTLARLKQAQPPALTFDGVDTINSYFESLEESERQRKSSFEAQAATAKAVRQTQYEQAQAVARQHNADLLVPIKQKHETLLALSSQLDYVFKHYGISPLSVDISDDITLKEFNTLVDSSVEVCTRYQKREGKLFPLVTKPLKGNPNLAVTLGFCGAILLCCYIALPFIAIPIMYLFCKSIHGMYQDMDTLCIARALMAQTDYNRFVDENDIQTVEEVSTTDIDEQLSMNLSTIKSYNTEREAALNSLRDDTNIGKQCAEVTAEVKKQFADRIQQMEKFLCELNAAIDDYMSKVTHFPSEQKSCLCMCHDFVLSRTPENIDVITKLPFQNFVFDDTDHAAAIKLSKLYLANALLSVQVKQLTVEIFDPLTMCADYTEFLTKDTQTYIKPNSGTLQDLMKLYRQYSQTNVIALHGKTIDEFNKDAEERELPPVEYKLLILVSGLDALEKDETKKEFDPFFDFSMRNGVWMWMFSTTSREGSVFIDGKNHASGNPIQGDYALCTKATEIYSTTLEKFKDRGIDYVVKYGDKFIPRSKWWTWDTIHEIFMPIGLMDGDPTKGLNVAPAVGDANVHSLLAGATGAGKSAAINEMLMSLITMYPPSELVLVYVDFKNVEAAKFTRGYDKNAFSWMDPEVEDALKKREAYYQRLSRIPHLRIISGTTDGEYALSIFQFLMDEMADRQKIINKAGVTKLEEMRKQILDRYNKEHNCKKTWLEMRNDDWDWYKVNVYDVYGDLPRMLIVLDEFQVMFNPEFVDPKIIDKINGMITAITKLARAMGCHFWFTSQSMKGTMSADTMSNFSLRMALRCSPEVSTEIIGNPASGTIKAKFGYMYSNDSAGNDATANRLWRVPFLDEKKLPNYIDPLYDMMQERHESHHMAEFYDEKVLVPSTVLQEWYDTYDSFDNPRTFIFGERAAFTVVPTPTNITLKVDDGEGFVISAFEREDLMNIALTVLDNIRAKGDKATCIINCMDKDMATAMKLDDYIDERFADLAGPGIDVKEFIDALRYQIDARKEAGATQKPLYVVLIAWEKCPGIGVDNNIKLSDAFKAVVRDASAQGVHIVLVMRDKGEMPRSLVNQLKHKICGQLMQDQSTFFMQTSKAEKLPSHAAGKGIFALYEYGSSLEKFKIYQHEFGMIQETSVKTLQSRATA